MEPFPEGYTISTDLTQLNMDMIHTYLSKESYWAKNIPRDLLQRSIENAFCFLVLKGKDQVGFARVITDKATFAYIADVFILEQHRGKGLGVQLMQAILDCPELQGLRSWMLATKDAHGLYEKFGFGLVADTTRIMRKQGKETY